MSLETQYLLSLTAAASYALTSGNSEDIRHELVASGIGLTVVLAAIIYKDAPNADQDTSSAIANP